jgi:hypothetical protein
MKPSKLPTHFTPENTVVTVWEENYSRNPAKTDQKRRSYCPILRGTNFGMGSLGVLTNEVERTVEIEDFEIWNKHTNADGFRRRGAGKLLMQACIADLKAVGFTELHSESISSSALHVRQRILTAGSMRFFLENTPDVPVPITIEQAVQATKHMEHEYRKANLLEYDLGENSANLTYFGAVLDLSKVDTEGWPTAVDQDAYLESVRTA